MFSKRNGVTKLSNSTSTWRAYPSAFSESSAYQTGSMMSGDPLQQENANLRAAVYEMEGDREKLRSVIRKLKVENSRLKLKLDRVAEAAKSSGDMRTVEELSKNVDFNQIKEFLLIGGPKDPLDVQYEASIKDLDGNSHKTGERYLWFRMAQHFNDNDAASQLLVTDDIKKAQELVNNVKNFDQASWDSVKLKHYEDYQRMKFDQHRALRCLLLKTGSLYLAIASQDKTYGTGWRKQRVEADQPKLWDGENKGGEILMQLRDEYSAHHSWISTAEEKEAQKEFDTNKRTIWRRLGGGDRFGSGGGGGGFRRKPDSAPLSGAGGGGIKRGASTTPRGGKRGGGRGASANSMAFGAASFYSGDGYTSFSSNAPSAQQSMGYSGSFATRSGITKRRRGL